MSVGVGVGVRVQVCVCVCVCARACSWATHCNTLQHTATHCKITEDWVYGNCVGQQGSPWDKRSPQVMTQVTTSHDSMQSQSTGMKDSERVWACMSGLLYRVKSRSEKGKKRGSKREGKSKRQANKTGITIKKAG